jgi:hypothetical protein
LIWFPSILWWTPKSTGPIFLWVIWGEWRKVPVDDQCHRSFKMAAIPFQVYRGQNIELGLDSQLS